MTGDLHRGRKLFRARAWAEAFAAFASADRDHALEGDDLEELATAAYLVGRDADYLNALERAHHSHSAAGKKPRAARCAFWVGLRLMFRGEAGPATGWFARAQRLLEQEEHGDLERGYLLLPIVEQHLAADDWARAYGSAQQAAATGERYSDADLVAVARHLQGHVRIEQGLIAEGLELFDEAMVAATTGELSPIVTGLVYCGVIDGCQRVFAISRAREWTSAMARWCDQQPEMVAFTGLCQVHRAEILQLHGRWSDALSAAGRARARCEGINRQAAAAAIYQQAEVHRLRGEYEAADEAYRATSEMGLDPYPGLALLRLLQGRVETAAAAIRRVTGAAADRWQRARLLPAYIEISLAAGNIEDARSACTELQGISSEFEGSVLGAIASQALGAVELAEGNARHALGPLRHACQLWQKVQAPYMIGRVRALIGLCCRALGDDEGGKLELEAARKTFEELGAIPDLRRLDALLRSTSSDRLHGLTQRELQVLRLMASGKTNKAMATQLSLSEKTVERHVSNIFAKLDVPSRSAATAYAYEHGLI